MKKQKKPSIKAHLLWSALILLALLGVCAIPFALAQRGATKRSVAITPAGAQAANANPLHNARPSPGPAGATSAQTQFDQSRIPANHSDPAITAFRMPPQPKLP